MTIKELAYSSHQQLQASTGASLRRAHIYELLAASFGFNTYAALGVENVLTQQRSDDERIASHCAFVNRRCIELGYPPKIADTVSVELGSFLKERQIGVVPISEFIRRLHGNRSLVAVQSIDYDNEQFADEKNDRLTARLSDNDEIDISPLALEGLEIAAGKGNALAHYALALIYAPEDNDETDRQGGSSYWYSQAQQGRVLTGVQSEWADAYAARLAQADKYANHLREAGRLGNQSALLDLADRFGDPSYFERRHDDTGADPSVIAEIAERLGRVADAKHWLSVAAERGDLEAMRRLIEGHDHGDLERCWTWVYLSRLFGTDITKDAHYAINDDGTEYDDEIGGPAYVAGRDGVVLEPLDAVQDAAARGAAQDLFSRVQQSVAMPPG